MTIVIGTGFVKDHLLLRAHSLTFLTLLSIIPLLALAVTFIDLVGGSNQILEWAVDQITAGSQEAKDYLMPLVTGLNFRALGPVSGGILIASTVLTIGAAEQALNAVWGVTEQRPWVRRIPDYLAVLVVAPLVAGIALPIATGLQSQALVLKLLEFPAFAFIYETGPALRARPRHDLRLRVPLLVPAEHPRPAALGAPSVASSPGCCSRSVSAPTSASRWDSPRTTRSSVPLRCSRSS